MAKRNKPSRTRARAQRQQRKELAQIDAMERKLERSAMPKIRRELNIIGRDATTAYTRSGEFEAHRVIDNGKAAISDVLERVYQSTIKKTEKLLKDLYKDDKKKIEQVRRELERNFKKQAQKAADQIAESTKRQVTKVNEKAYNDNLSSTEAEKILKNKIAVNGRRAQLISEVEIGSVTAEGRDKLSRKKYKKDVRKVWVTTRDSKVRDPHQHAEGQEVGINENFVIRGKRTERIPYPRHRSASTWNRCNCRCRVAYINP